MRDTGKGPGLLLSQSVREGGNGRSQYVRIKKRATHEEERQGGCLSVSGCGDDEGGCGIGGRVWPGAGAGLGRRH